MNLVLKTDFHKGLHVKMNHPTVSADIITVFDSFTVELN